MPNLSNSLILSSLNSLSLCSLRPLRFNKTKSRPQSIPNLCTSLILSSDLLILFLCVLCALCGSLKQNLVHKRNRIALAAVKNKKTRLSPQMLRQKTTQANIDVNLSLPEIKLSHDTRCLRRSRCCRPSINTRSQLRVASPTQDRRWTATVATPPRNQQRTRNRRQ